MQSSILFTILIFSFIFLIVLCPDLTQACEPVIIHEDYEWEELTPYLQLYEDETGALTLEDITKPLYEEKFQPAGENIPNYGATSSVIWIKFSIQNNSQLDHLFLEILYPLYLIELYIPFDQETIIKKLDGLSIPSINRDIPHRYPIFRLDLEQNSLHTVYIRITSQYSLVFPSRLYAPECFETISAREDIAYTLYLGILIALFFYNFMLTFVLKDKTYLFYVLFIVGFIFYQIILTGYGGMYLWPTSDWWKMVSLYVFLYLSIGAFLRFSQLFLNTKEKTPRLHRYSLIYMGIVALAIPLSLIVPITPANHFSILMGIIGITFFLSFGILSYKRGNKAARFYLIAWTAFFISGFSYALSIVDLLPRSLITQHGILVSMGLGVILLSLALADRILLIKREKEEAQEEAIKHKNIAINSLTEADRIKDEFIANTSHQLRTPLNSIIGFIDLLLTDPHLPEKFKKSILLVENSSKLLLSIINDLLDLSMIEAKKLELHSEPVSIESLFKTVETSAQLWINKNFKRIKLQYYIDPDINDYIEADPIRLHQILYNLIHNSVKFTNRGLIEIGVQLQSEQYLEFYVKDSGIGIAKEKHDIIFKPFEQADRAIFKRYGGTGLGLTIAKKLVELMEGKIKVESSLNQGSIFWFTLPYQKVDFFIIEDKSNKEKQMEEQVKQNAIILIAEDESINQRLIKFILEQNGYKAVIADDGEEALATFEEHPEIALILMDIKMPYMDGYETTKAIRNLEKEQDLKHTPIIALTAYATKNDEKKVMESGFDYFLTKPIDKPKLLQVIKEQLLKHTFQDS